VGSVLGIGNRFFLQCLPFVCVRELRLRRQCADCSWTFGSVNCYWDLVFCLAAFCTAVCIFYFIFCEEETLSPLALSRSRTLCIWALFVLFGFVVIAGFASAGFFSDDSNAVFGFYLGHFLLGEFDRIFTHQLHMESDWRTPHVFGFLSRPPLFYLYFTLHSATHTHLNTGWLAFVVAWHLIHELRLASVRYNILAFPRVLCYLSSWYTTHRECQ